MTHLHVIFGSGQIGSRLAQLLLERGHRVRVVSRHPVAPAGAQTLAGDARDLAFAERAAEGAVAVYDTMNPPYHQWKRELLPIASGALHGAKRAGAKLVALDCLYMYGVPDGPITETTPMKPCSKKGTLRAELAELRLGANHPVAIARASDFFGPSLPLSSWSERFFTRVLAGKPAECLGDPDLPHSYTYADDVALALALLGETADATGIWHVPTAPAESTRALAQRIGSQLGIEIGVTTFSPLMLRTVGLFVPFLRELPEMAYQWHVPYVLDDTKFRTRFGIAPTPIDTQVRATVAWARERFISNAKHAYAS